MYLLISRIDQNIWKYTSAKLEASKRKIYDSLQACDEVTSDLKLGGGFHWVL